MKKKTILILGVCVLVVLSLLICFGFDTSKEIPDKALVYRQLDTGGEEFVLAQLEGIHRDTLIGHWGEPDGSLFGLFGDIWELTAEEFVVVYYATEATVQDIRLKNNT